MFTATTLGLFIAGVAVILAMPGPTNTLLAAAGLRNGFAGAARLTGAELAGYLVSITVWGCFLEQAGHAFAWLPAVLRASASVYIAYLSIRMWRAAQTVPSAAQQMIRMRTLFVATLLNPKGILFASAIFPPAAFLALGSYLAAMAIFAALLMPIGLMWVAFGASLGSQKMKWVSPAQVQRGASLVLGAFSLSLAWAAFR